MTAFLFKQNPRLQKLFFWILSFSYFNFFAQRINLVDSINNLEISIGKKEFLIDSLIKNKRIQNLYVIQHHFAYWLFNQKDIEKALYFENKAIKGATKARDTSFLKTCLFDAGYYYRKNGDFKKSIISFNSVLNLKPDKEEIKRTYFQIALLYKHIGNYAEALKYYELAFILYNKENKELQKIQIIANNISNLCYRIKDRKILLKGVFYGKKADSIAGIIETSSTKKYSIKINLASNYNELGYINNALLLYKQALDISSKNHDSLRIGKTYLLLGNLFNSLHQKKSIDYIYKASSYFSYKDSLMQFKIHYNYALTYAFSGKYEKSIEYAEKSLSFLLGNKNLDIELIDVELLIKNRYKTSLLHILSSLGEIYLLGYKNNHDDKFLDRSIIYFKKADKIVDLLSQNMQQYKSKLFWRQISMDIYSKAIEASYLLNDIESAFYFMEKNKALLFMKEISEQNYKRVLKIDSSLLKREIEIKQTLYSVETLLDDNKFPTERSKDSLLLEQLNLERKLNSFQDDVYSDILNHKSPEIFPLIKLQNSLKENKALIEYHVPIESNRNNLYPINDAYMMVITRSTLQIIKINHQKRLQKDIERLIELQKKPFKTLTDQKEFTHLSYQVYKILFPFKKEIISGKTIRIIPDAYLSYLPFESLIINENNPTFLIEKFPISYLYSYSFLKNSLETEFNNSSDKILNRYIGFAPMHFNKIGLPDLDNSLNELFSLNNYYPGEQFIDSTATKDNFINNVRNYRIIHLATHANASDSISPWIAFYDEKLYLKELFLIENSASLVVLSSCNTATGKYEIGEGIMSLAKGFFYSGSKSVISSLWSIDDNSSSQIMEDFYKNLYNGKNKSIALRNAKLNYIQNHSLSDVSPYYWASFVLLGKDDVILNSKSNHWAIYLGVFIVVFLSFYFYNSCCVKNK